MSAIQPPANRLWWKEPIERIEITWVLIAFVWSMVLFFMMPYWHVFGSQNLANEAYKNTPEKFTAKTQEMVDKYKVREETGLNDQKIPVVHPPAGGDVYLIARLWQWWPILELEAGQTYRLHLMSMDWLHGFSLQPENINIEVHPNYEHVLTVQPTKAGTYSIICNEYCGLNHHTMASRLFVTEKK
ncbi:MAG: cytochrome C oxidase subunit II [Betaproteobacteria bacterium]|jgi:cytochrome c oxidase subunit 2|nr:cytochrome C oxidase subunit II [Betaproteobacteria bacterium]